MAIDIDIYRDTAGSGIPRRYGIRIHNAGAAASLSAL